MNELGYEKKLKIILEIVDKFQLTAYEIGTNTKMNVSGVSRIFDKTVKKPHEKSVDKIFNWFNSQEKYAIYIRENIINDPTQAYTTIPQLQERVRELERFSELKDQVIKLLEEKIETILNASKNKNES
ncbi:hypothetical protein G4D82_10475 [Flavobacterium sp. CYK-4]|uniref:hypothetical protein n=1 Tax=Flavobacterium lotistagni TaxID=2709660 RepID=UPI00140B2D17|nr:hypothetical protein [Flavobacterium lotistagni]NHM07648.1 hypothetical protein [Flavobacterium lotistagni]